MNLVGPCERDVIVVGGGPAGSTAAAFLARDGLDVLLLERDRFPRFHIGESLLPATNEILKDLGVAQRVHDAGFVVKRGASFLTEDGKRESYIDFSVSSEVHEPTTYQVPRDRFDQILLDNARTCGAEVVEGARAEHFTSEGSGVRVGYSLDGGERRNVMARVLIDASGQAGFLAKRLRLRRKDPLLRCVAIHSQYEGVRQLEGKRAGDIRIISLQEMGWLWLIPLSSTRTSVGAVLHREALTGWERQGGDVLELALSASPAVAELFAGARRAAPVRRDADFSYTPSRYAGDRWLLAGDAASFLDPVFSTGVLLALKSGREAARAVVRALHGGRLRRGPLARYERSQRRVYAYFRRTTAAFYDPAFRDMMFQPSNRFGILEALVSTFAGNSNRSPRRWLRLTLLFALVACHRRFGFVDRIHRWPEGEATA